MKKFITSIMAFCLIYNVFANYNARVNSDGILNVRVRANTSCDVVGQLNKNDVVQVISVNDGWAKIVAPKNIKVYVHESLVKDSVTTSKVNLRCGAGTNFQSYGIIPPNTQLKILAPAQNSWIKIEPLSTMYVYVASKFLDIEKSPITNNVNQKNAKDENKSNVNDIPQVDIPDKSTKRKLIPSDKYKSMTARLEKLYGDATVSVKTGKLVRCSTPPDHPVKYALVVNGEKSEKYFVVAEIPDFYFDQIVTIKGDVHPVKDWQKSVIVADEIEITAK